MNTKNVTFGAIVGSLLGTAAGWLGYKLAVRQKLQGYERDEKLDCSFMDEEERKLVPLGTLLGTLTGVFVGHYLLKK